MVAEVLYPGLPSFAGHAAARKQMSGGFGGMLSVRVKGGERAAIASAARVELWKRATSLGGVESLISIAPASKDPARPARPTCCACRSASRRRATSSTTSIRRCGAAITL